MKFGFLKKEASRFSRGFLFAILFQTELLVELIHAAAGIDKLLLAGIKGVTLGADFDLDVTLCTAGLNDLSAGAPDSGLLVLGMDALLHCVHLFLQSFVFTQRIF